jgi:subtilisin
MKVKWRTLWSLLLSAVLLFTMSFQFVLADSAPNSQKGNYIVQLRDSVNPDQAASQLAKQYNIQVSHVYKYAIKGFSGTLSSQSAAALRNNPNVQLIEQDIEFYTNAQTLPTGIDRIEADNNSIANIDNSDDRVDIDIAIIDTGIDTDHPDLNVYNGRNFANGPSWKYDDGNGHGTHVAGTTAALDNDIGVVGVAPGARLWAVRVLNDNGSGWLSDIIAGVDWVTQHADEIEVANMSLGGQGLSDSFHTAIKNSVAAGVFYAVAAGNSTDDVYGGDGIYGTDDDYLPASYPEVATISALSDTDGAAGGSGPLSSWGGDDRNNDGVDDGEDDSFAWFSNHSTNVVEGNPVTSSGAAIDLLLPGVDIYSTVPDGSYDTYSGTSMASPHAAGLAALYYASEGTRDINGDGNLDQKDVYAVRQALIDRGEAQEGVNGLTQQNDPDTNWEYIGWATATASSGDKTPTASWVNPQDGDKVHDTITLQIDANDAEDSTDTLIVEWRIDNGTWKAAAYNSLTGYFEDTLDTTALIDGEHILDTRATDSAENTSTVDTITISVNNSGGSQSDMYVWDISFTEKEYGNLKDPKHDLTVTVTINHDSDTDGTAEASDDPVSNAVVYIKITNDSGSTWKGSGETNSNGQVSFLLKNVPTGTYEAYVTDVTHDVYIYHSTLDDGNPNYHTIN